MNSSKLQTILGAVLAVVTALGDYLVHNPMDGGAFKQPTFYLGLVGAIAFALKGYYAQGTPPSGTTVVTKPTA